MATPTRRSPERGRRRVIALSIAAAVAFWLSIRLSDRYTSTAVIDLAYALPTGTAFAREPPRSIDATVTATGWELLRERFRKARRTLRIDSADLRRNPDGIIQLSGKIREAFLGGDLRVEALSDPRIVLRTEAIVTRRLPLRLVADVTYGPGYSGAGEPRLSVDTVTVRGPRSALAPLDSWPTDTVRLSGLREDTEVRVGISGVGDGTVEALPAEATVSLGVQQYTERTIEVPVRVVGYAGPDSVSAFPRVVRVTSAIGLSDYARISPEAYDVVVDVTGTEGAGVQQRPVTVRRAPEYAVSTSVSPRVVEVFVLRRVASAQ